MNQIHNEDCLTGMSKIPQNSVDLVLSDLPYAITQNAWDSLIPLDKLWTLWGYVLKPGGAIVLTASQPFTSILVSSNLNDFHHEWIWRKNKPTGHLNAHRMPMKIHESVLVFYHTKPGLYNPQGLKHFGKETRRGHNGDNYGDSGSSNFQDFTNYPRSILSFDLDEEQLHPTQKPVQLFSYLINTYSNEGDVVLDSCMGSGTTAVAAIATGRQFIGFETDANYCDIANERITKAENMQRFESLFE